MNYQVFTWTKKDGFARWCDFFGTWDECREYCRGYCGSLHTSALVILDHNGFECERWTDAE